MLKNVDLKKLNPYEKAVSILTVIYLSVLLEVLFGGCLIVGQISFYLFAILFPFSLFIVILASFLNDNWYSEIRQIRDFEDKK